MDSRKALTIDEFCEEQRFSRSHYYNLKQIGRAPRETRSGGLVTISPDNAEAWRKDIESNPIITGVRRCAEQLRTVAA